MCEYCEKRKKIEEDENDNIYLSIIGEHLMLLGTLPMISRYFGRDILINYCPMCGRKLGE